MEQASTVDWSPLQQRLIDVSKASFNINSDGINVAWGLALHVSGGSLPLWTKAWSISEGNESTSRSVCTRRVVQILTAWPDVEEWLCHASHELDALAKLAPHDSIFKHKLITAFYAQLLLETGNGVSPLK